MNAYLLGILRSFSWVSLAAVFVLSVVPAWMRPVVAEPALEHAAGFFVIGALFGFAQRMRLAAIVVVALCYASLIEAIQLFVPGRHARLSDLLIDGAAMLVGGALGWSTREMTGGQYLSDKVPYRR